MQSFDDADLDAVAKFANDTEYGLSSSVWTRNLKAAHLMARKIRAGTVCINTHNYGDPAWPFGGYKQSGWGREIGQGSDGALHRDEGRRRPALTIARLNRFVRSAGRQGAALARFAGWRALRGRLFL